jgi:hypothetical protein
LIINVKLTLYILGVFICCICHSFCPGEVGMLGRKRSGAT